MKKEKILSIAAIMFILGLSLFFLMEIPKLKVDNDVEIFLPKNNKERIVYDNMEEIFGSDDGMIMAVESKAGDIFDKDYLENIKNITNEIEKYKYVEEVTSITNVDYINGTKDGMEVGEIAEKLPENDMDMKLYKEKLLSWKEMYKKNLYSKNYKASQIIIELKTDLTAMEKEEAYIEIEKISKKYVENNINIYIAGQAAIDVEVGRNMQKDLGKLVPFVLIVVIIFLYMSFRSIGNVFLTAVTVVLSTVWTIGFMAFSGTPMTMISTIIPILLIAIGTADAIHIISHYNDELLEIKGEINFEKNKEAVLVTMRKIGKAIF